MVGLDEFPPLVSLAPMAGVTDIPFRRQVKALGGNYCVSEMIAGDALARARTDMVRRAAGAGTLTPLVIQLAGREARWMREGAKLAEAAGADVIDINMGCPAKSVTSGLSGSALMRDPDHALSLIEASVRATTLPVTLKMRLGWDGASMNAADIARRAEVAGVRHLRPEAAEATAKNLARMIVTTNARLAGTVLTPQQLQTAINAKVAELMSGYKPEKTLLFINGDVLVSGGGVPK